MALFTSLNTNSQQSYHLIYSRTAVNLLRPEPTRPPSAMGAALSDDPKQPCLFLCVRQDPCRPSSLPVSVIGSLRSIKPNAFSRSSKALPRTVTSSGVKHLAFRNNS